MAITLNGSANTIAGLAVGGLPDGTVDSDTLAASVDYIRDVDHWWINTSATMSDGDYFTSNWERGDVHFEVIGSGMSESSGVFTFPNAGKWLVMSQWNGYDITNSDTSYIGVRTWISTDSGSNYTLNLSMFTNGAGVNNDAHWNLNGSRIYDVTNASTFRMKFNVYTGGNQSWFGNTSWPYCGLTFIRLGAT